MGFFSRLFGKEDPPVKPASDETAPETIAPAISTPDLEREAVFLPGTGRGYFLEVQGESFYQDALNKWLKMRPNRETPMRLTAEPLNPHDPNAVAVQTLMGETVGYLARADAARYQQLITQIETAGSVGVCKARLVGGTAGKENIGVYLDVEPATIVASKLKLTYKRRSK